MDNLFDPLVDAIAETTADLVSQVEALPSMEMKVEVLNAIRKALHAASPFVDEPVDCVLWVKKETVQPNDYNPNVVYKPEKKLLNVSIKIDHFTQPVVAHDDRENGFIVVDGEHRYIAGSTRFAARLNGYLPISVTKTRTRAEGMASTVRHNRARGVHQLDGMTGIVSNMLQAGWTDDRIAKELGMDADEILRIKQVGGIAATYSRPYNRAWVVDDGQSSETS